MIIKINYNKTTGDITVNNDIPECAIVINENSTVDSDQELDVEIALNTSYLKEIQTAIEGIDGSIN
jgi:hypothetical protein|tara:strand:+ start:155 stop:352 length:198 start_codon:yes stop_codon:yes gene_type:complete